jgi:DNA-binding transcriptional ArsR family regulator
MRAKPSAKAFTALGYPVRRLIYERLARNPMTVGELAKGLSISRPAVSQHLRVLRLARLIDVWETDGRRLYQLDPEGLQPLTDWLGEHRRTAAEAAARRRR